MNAQQLQPFILPIGLLVIFYFFVIRPQKKKEAEIREMRDNLRVGDEVITIGGIYGKVLKVKEEMVTIEVGAAKTKLDMTRWAVGSVINKSDSRNNKSEETKIDEENE